MDHVDRADRRLRTGIPACGDTGPVGRRRYWLFSGRCRSADHYFDDCVVSTRIHRRSRAGAGLCPRLRTGTGDRL